MLFDNNHIKEYHQAFLIWIKPNKETVLWKGILGIAYFGHPINQEFIGNYSLADIILQTGMVKSKGELKRLLKQNGISALKWNSVYLDLFEILPHSDMIYEVRKGQRALQIITGCNNDSKGIKLPCFKNYLLSPPDIV